MARNLAVRSHPRTCRGRYQAQPSTCVSHLYTFNNVLTSLLAFRKPAMAVAGRCLARRLKASLGRPPSIGMHKAHAPHQRAPGLSSTR